ncbi:MAG: hypothetical protein K2Q10_04200, partial [Rhodospirillales bacterium]|nr:hypothetical protein [Rhodospirillales bacterium]
SKYLRGIGLMVKRYRKLPGSPALRFALAAVRAMGDPDLVLVPRQPTADMLAAGARAGNVPPQVAAQVFAAMVGCCE